jgi:hypothetical protein
MLGFTCLMKVITEPGLKRSAEEDGIPIQCHNYNTYGMKYSNKQGVHHTEGP